MAIIQSGATTDTMTVDPTFKAARVTLRPYETASTTFTGGAYRGLFASGSIAAATAAASTTESLANFKYTGTGVCVVRRVQVGLQVTTAYTQGGMYFLLYPVRTSYTQGTTGGTLQTLTGNNVKLRTSHATSSSTIYVTTTAKITSDAAPDTTPIAGALFNLPAAISASPVAGMVDLLPADPMSHPLVLAQNEGFQIKNATAFAATGVSTMLVGIEWFEMPSF